MKVLLDNQLVDEENARIPIKNRGLLFGVGLYETLRSYAGKLPFLDRHLKRLEVAAVFLGMAMPHPRELKDGILALLSANQLQDARIKIIITPKTSSFRPTPISEEDDLHVLIVCEEFKALSPEFYKKGVALKIIRAIGNDQPLLANLKSLSWLAKIIARKEIAEAEVFDGILLNHHGFVTETTAANLFWIKNGVVMTAPGDAGLLSGVTRELVMEICEDENIPCRETMAKPEDLLSAEEIFMTGSTIEILPVSSLAGEKIGTGLVGRLTKKICQHYAGVIKSELGAV